MYHRWRRNIADWIVLHRLSWLLVPTKNYNSTVLKCPKWWEPQNPAILKSNRLLERCHLVKRAFSLIASRNLFTWNGSLAQCLNKTRCILFARIGKSQQTWREANTARTELNVGWQIWKWNLSKVRMDKGNCVVNFEFHYQMYEFLAHSKELRSVKSAHLSFHYIIYITGKLLLQRPLIAS